MRAVARGRHITGNRGDHLTLILRPHIEHRNGCRFHLDRFDACLNGELILTSRQPWYGAARELLRRGYPGDTLLTLRPAGKDDDGFVPLEIVAVNSCETPRCGLMRRLGAARAAPL
jgi:hypothetical protein